MDAEEIRAEAREQIEGVVNSEEKLLRMIYVSDALNENTELLDRLYRRMEHVASKYQGMFHSDQAAFATGTAGNVFGAVGGIWISSHGEAGYGTR